MAAIGAPILGTVSGWTNNSALIATGFAPASFILNQSSDGIDITPMVPTSGHTRAFSGLKSWSGTIVSRRSPAVLGVTGTVTYGSGYVANARAWNLSLNAVEHDVTVFNTTDLWASFVPGLLSASGSFDALLDATTPISGLAVAAAAAQFMYDPAGSQDQWFSGNILITGQGVTIDPTQLATVNQTFVFDSTITHRGNSNPPFTDNVAVTSVAGPLSLLATTGRTYAGTAFWTSIEIQCVYGEPVVFTINFRGSGALTIG